MLLHQRGQDLLSSIVVEPRRKVNKQTGKDAASGSDPSRENGIAERPQALRYPENKNLIPLFMRKANAERILNRPALTQKPALRAQSR